MRPVRLIVDAPAAGAANMAIDETLLRTAGEHGIATLRLYGWSDPTLSLGYFQSSADRAQHPPSLGCPVVRRASGGGAIVHDHELTYCVALPQSTSRTPAATALYDSIHESLIATLAGFGIAARCFQTFGGPVPASNRQEPFLCFERRAPGDVIVRDYKVVGSAQRRHRGAVLQHGSILLKRSLFAPELPGLADLAGAAMDPESLIAAWTPRLARSLGWSFEPSALTPGELAAAGNLAASRFETDTYLNRRH